MSASDPQPPAKHEHDFPHHGPNAYCACGARQYDVLMGWAKSASPQPPHLNALWCVQCAALVAKPHLCPHEPSNMQPPAVSGLTRYSTREIVADALGISERNTAHGNKLGHNPSWIKAADVDDAAARLTAWEAEARKTLSHLGAALEQLNIPHRVDWREWIDQLVEKFLPKRADVLRRKSLIGAAQRIVHLRADLENEDMHANIMELVDPLLLEATRLREERDLADRKQSEIFEQLEAVRAAMRGDDVSASIHPLVLSVASLRATLAATEEKK